MPNAYRQIYLKTNIFCHFQWGYIVISINQLLTVVNSAFNFLIYWSFCGAGTKSRKRRHRRRQFRQDSSLLNGAGGGSTKMHSSIEMSAISTTLRCKTTRRFQSSRSIIASKYLFHSTRSLCRPKFLITVDTTRINPFSTYVLYVLNASLTSQNLCTTKYLKKTHIEVSSPNLSLLLVQFASELVNYSKQCVIEVRLKIDKSLLLKENVF